MGNITFHESTIVDMENIIQLTEQLIDSYLNEPGIIQCIHRILNFDKALFRHCSNVAFLSLMMGRAKYKRPKTIYEVFLAALLHDYGKIYVEPRDILDKPGSLTAMERRIIEQHSVMGYIYLKQYTRLSERILNGVLQHHEKLNGSGYILCKKGDDISEYAKIIAIADVYDAMVSERVYHKQFTKEEALEYLRDNKEACFENELADIFIDYMIKTQCLDVIRMEEVYQMKILDHCKKAVISESKTFIKDGC